jgi:hypothetical protein
MRLRLNLSEQDLQSNNVVRYLGTLWVTVGGVKDAV